MAELGLLDDATLQHTAFFLNAPTLVALSRCCHRARALCDDAALLGWVGSVRHATLPSLRCAEQLALAEALALVAHTLEFEWGATRVTASSAEPLHRLAEVLHRHPTAAVLVEGHCAVEAPDSIAVPFSRARAAAVAGVLAASLRARGEEGVTVRADQEEEEAGTTTGGGAEGAKAAGVAAPPSRVIRAVGLGKSRAKVAAAGHEAPEEGGDPNRRCEIFVAMGGVEFPPRTPTEKLVDCARRDEGGAAARAHVTDLMEQQWEVFQHHVMHPIMQQQLEGLEGSDDDDDDDDDGDGEESESESALAL